MSDNYEAQIGHNGPPAADTSDVTLLLNPFVMRDQLELDYLNHIRRRDELLAGAERLLAPGQAIVSEDLASKATDFVGQLKLLMRDVELDRSRHARPLLDAQGVIQKFFKAEVLDPLTKAAGDIEVRLKFYARAKAEEARRVLEQERRAAKQAAEDATAKALASMRPSHLEDAAELVKTAEKAEAKAEGATTAALAQVRGSHGATMSYVAKWDFELLDLAAVPREFLMIDVAKIRQHIAAGLRDTQEGPGIPGLKIFDNATVRVRT